MTPTLPLKRQQTVPKCLGIPPLWVISALEGVVKVQWLLTGCGKRPSELCTHFRSSLHTNLLEVTSHRNCLQKWLEGSEVNCQSWDVRSYKPQHTSGQGSGYAMMASAPSDVRDLCWWQPYTLLCFQSLAPETADSCHQRVHGCIVCTP